VQLEQKCEKSIFSSDTKRMLTNVYQQANIDEVHLQSAAEIIIDRPI